MRLVVISDVHLDARFAWAGPEVARKRRRAIQTTLTRIVDLALEIQADALLCAGDLYENERFSPDSGAFLRTTFERLHPTPVFLAPGNHDWLGPQSLYARERWSPNVHTFGESRLTPFALADGLTLWGAAHHAPANTDSFLDRFRVDRGGVNLALFHGSERHWLAQQESGKVAHAPFDAADIERAGLSHAFVGHFHTPRDAAHHTYPGNPEPLSFGEAGERGLVIADIGDDGTVTRHRRRVSETQLHDLQVDVSGCRSGAEARERVAAALVDRRGLARVTIGGELDASVDLSLDDLADCAPWMEAVVTRVGQVSTPYDLDRIALEPTVRGQFVREVRAATLDEEQKRRVLLIGLRALEGRNDLDVF